MAPSDGSVLFARISAPRTWLLALAIVVLPLARLPHAYGQSQADTSEGVAEAPTQVALDEINKPGQNVVHSVSLLSDKELLVSAALIVFGVIIILIEFSLLKAIAKRTEEVVRAFTVTLIIIGTLILISSGFSSQQISPALGLFGTIAGYLLGRAETRRTNGAGNSEGGSPR